MIVMCYLIGSRSRYMIGQSSDKRPMILALFFFPLINYLSGVSLDFRSLLIDYRLATYLFESIN